MKRAYFYTLIAAAACACLLIPLKTSSAMTNSPIATFRDGTNPGKLNGYWRSRGYGWVLAVKNGKVYFYNESSSHCIKDKDATEDLDELGKLYQISDDSQTMRLPIGDDSYFYTFDRLDSLPETCHQKLDTTPKSVLDSFIEMFSKHYAFFDSRDINWPTVVDSTTKRAEANMSSTDVLDVIKGVLAKFDDDHVSVEAKIDDEKIVLNARQGQTISALTAQAYSKGKDAEDHVDDWLKRIWKKDIGKTLLHGEGWKTANGKIRYGFVDGDIGYIAIRSMEALASDDDDEDKDIKAAGKAIDKALKRLKGARAMIVDVSLNDGGYDKVARAIAGRFASERTLGYYKYAGDSEADKPQAIFIEPSGKRRYTGPVYLVTSDITVSAAEIFTMSMRALPNVTHVGGTTRGALSDMLWKPLPNGWTLSLSNEVYLDAGRKAWEGAGIPPQVPMEIFSTSDITSGPLKAIRTVVDLARDKKPGSVAQLQ
jgi:carboxyl-terminal processing protease